MVKDGWWWLLTMVNQYLFWQLTWFIQHIHSSNLATGMMHIRQQGITEALTIETAHGQVATGHKWSLRCCHLKQWLDCETVDVCCAPMLVTRLSDTGDTARVWNATAGYFLLVEESMVKQSLTGPSLKLWLLSHSIHGVHYRLEMSVLHSFDIIDDIYI